jgi:hypothetical protein
MDDRTVMQIDSGAVDPNGPFDIWFISQSCIANRSRYRSDKKNTNLAVIPCKHLVMSALPNPPILVSHAS